MILVILDGKSQSSLFKSKYTFDEIQRGTRKTVMGGSIYNLIYVISEART